MVIKKFFKKNQKRLDKRSGLCYTTIRKREGKPKQTGKEEKKMYCSADHTIIKIEKFDIADNNTRYGQKFKKALVGKSYTEAKAMVLAYTHCPAREISTYYSTDSWVKEMYVRGAHSTMIISFDKTTRKVQCVF